MPKRKAAELVDARASKNVKMARGDIPSGRGNIRLRVASSFVNKYQTKFNLLNYTLPKL